MCVCVCVCVHVRVCLFVGGHEHMPNQEMHYRGIPQLTIKLLQLLCLPGALPPGPAAHATQREEEGKRRHGNAQHAHLGALQEGGEENP